MALEREGCAARLEVDYPEQLDRLTTFFRLIWIIPIAIIAGLLMSGDSRSMGNEAGEVRPALAVSGSVWL